MRTTRRDEVRQVPDRRKYGSGIMSVVLSEMGSAAIATGNPLVAAPRV